MPGRTRGLAVDVRGRVVAVVVLAADTHGHRGQHPAGSGKPGARGFTPLPKRWAVEGTYGWLMLHRRLARDCETLPTRSEVVIH
nr:hypothetical protein StreXyl84_65680 [Streptomyces sp. Xyl84]